MTKWEVSVLAILCVIAKILLREARNHSLQERKDADTAIKGIWIETDN